VSGVYVAAFYLYLFTGAAPTATINGTAVSLIPKTSIAGSGVQFSFQNTGRLLIPAIGGLVIDLLGDKVKLYACKRTHTYTQHLHTFVTSRGGLCYFVDDEDPVFPKFILS
jgi:hypothetical protein